MLPILSKKLAEVCQIGVTGLPIFYEILTIPGQFLREIWRKSVKKKPEIYAPALQRGGGRRLWTFKLSPLFWREVNLLSATPHKNAGAVFERIVVDRRVIKFSGLIAGEIRSANHL
jgi:hypothetical protein